MVDVEELIRAECEAFALQTERVAPDWDAVIARAGERNPALPLHLRLPCPTPRRRRKHVLAVVAAVLLVVTLAPLAALAVTHGWWFFSAAGVPKPVTGVATVTSGRWNGAPWALTAYRSATDGICFAMTPRPSSNPRGSGAAMDCDSISGVPRSPGARQPPDHRITYMTGSGGDLPPFIAGAVIASAETVEVVFEGGTSRRVSTLAAPSGLGARVRFYVARLSKGERVKAVVGRAASGRVVATIALRSPALPVTAFTSISNRGRLLRLPDWLSHQLRLMHRSTRIWLLATRDGRSYYRLPSVHAIAPPRARDQQRKPQTCFGVGKAVALAALPHTRRGANRLIGLIVCQPVSPTSFPSFHQPVWDMSVYGADRAHPQMRLLVLAGIASDAVKTMQLTGRGGRVIARVPVIDNVYSLRKVPSGVVGVRAADLNGHPLAVCLPKAPVTGTGSYLTAHC